MISYENPELTLMRQKIEKEIHKEPSFLEEEKDKERIQKIEKEDKEERY